MTRGLALIADPSPMFCEGLRRLLRQERFSVCAEGRDVAEALTRLDGAVDLTLVICTLDTEACQQNIMQLAVLRTRFPATKIIVIADTTLSPSLWRQALGITDAILAQDISSKILQHSIDLVMLGQKFFAAPPPETLFPEVTAPLPSVTPLLASRWHASESYRGRHPIRQPERPLGGADYLACRRRSHAFGSRTSNPQLPRAGLREQGHSTRTRNRRGDR